MLHAKFLRSPYANAMVKSVDVAAAKKVPGVVDVVTWEDEDLKNFGRRGGARAQAPAVRQKRPLPRAAHDAAVAQSSGFGPPAAGLGPIHHGCEPRLRRRARAADGRWADGPERYVDQIADMEDDEVAVIVVAETEEAL